MGGSTTAIGGTILLNVPSLIQGAAETEAQENSINTTFPKHT